MFSKGPQDFGLLHATSLHLEHQELFRQYIHFYSHLKFHVYSWHGSNW